MDYYPKGSMCFTCVHRFCDCTELPFSMMKVHEEVREVSIVICDEFERDGNNGLTRLCKQHVGLE